MISHPQTLGLIPLLWGPNGVGKSTFAHGLMGNPNYVVSGAAQLNGKDLLAMETFERSVEQDYLLVFQITS